MKISKLMAGLQAGGIAALCYATLSGTAMAQGTPPADNVERLTVLSGIWGGATTIENASAAACFNQAADVGGGRVSERTDVYGRKGGERWIAFEQDCGIRNRGRLNKPMYRPEFWERIRLIDYNANVGGEWVGYADPVWLNMPEGVPRIGAPNKIVFNNDPLRGPELVFLWVERNTFKIIPADCREHDPVLAFDQNLLGHATGCWDGDTFVVHSKGFSDGSWLHWSGWIHSNEMEVIERFTPNADGSELLYEVTVLDPVMFLEPFVMDPQVLSRNTNPEAMLLEDVPYVEHSLGVMALPRNRG